MCGILTIVYIDYAMCDMLTIVYIDYAMCDTFTIVYMNYVMFTSLKSRRQSDKYMFINIQIGLGAKVPILFYFLDIFNIAVGDDVVRPLLHFCVGFRNVLAHYSHAQEL